MIGNNQEKVHFCKVEDHLPKDMNNIAIIKPDLEQFVKKVIIFILSMNKLIFLN